MPKISAVSEGEIIRKCKQGDLTCQEKLYKHFYGYAMGVGLRYLYNRDDVLEVVNDAFIKAFKSIHIYKEDLDFKAWFRKIIVNTALDRRRKNLRQIEAIHIDEAYQVGGYAVEMDNLTVKDILNLLDTLPEIQRIVFNLYELDGYSHDEISLMIGIPSSSSRVYLGRAKEKLRKLLIESEQNI